MDLQETNRPQTPKGNRGRTIGRIGNKSFSEEIRKTRILIGKLKFLERIIESKPIPRKEHYLDGFKLIASAFLSALNHWQKDMSWEENFIFQIKNAKFWYLSYFGPIVKVKNLSAREKQHFASFKALLLEVANSLEGPQQENSQCE